MQANQITIEVKLLKKRNGDYKVYVFEDIRNLSILMVTELPNWGIPEIKEGDEGFLTYAPVLAGETKWYDHKNTKELRTYNYSGNYLLDFVPLDNVIEYDQNKQLIIEV